MQLQLLNRESLLSPASPIIQALGDLRQVAEYLEKGQAATPLGEAIDEALLRDTGDTIRALVYSPDPGVIPRLKAAAEAGPAVDGAVQLRLQNLAIDHLAAHAPALVQALQGTPTLLIVAPDAPLTDHQLEILELIAAAVPAHLPVDTGSSVSFTLPGYRLPPLRLADTSDAGQLDTPRRPELLRRLSLAARARETLALTGLLTDRHQAETRQLAARQRRELPLDRIEAPAVSDGPIDLAALRGAITDGLARVGQDLRETGRRAGLRTGPVLSFLDALLQNLTEADLDQEPAGKKTRLSLRPATSEDLCERFGAALRAEIQSDIDVFTDRLAELRTRLEPMAADARMSLAWLRPPDLDQVWGPIEEALHLQVRYRGEVARRGFLQRLGEGRRVIFVVLMMASLFGSFLGFNIRRMAGMGVLFLIIFVVTVALTFISWRKEDRISWDDELIRLRDILRSEFQRMLSEAMRERQTRLQMALDELRRQAVIETESAIRVGSITRSSEADAERRAARTRLKGVEQRLKELQALGQNLLRARAAAERELEAAFKPDFPRLPRNRPETA